MTSPSGVLTNPSWVKRCPGHVSPTWRNEALQLVPPPFIITMIERGVQRRAEYHWSPHVGAIPLWSWLVSLSPYSLMRINTEYTRLAVTVNQGIILLWPTPYRPVPFGSQHQYQEHGSDQVSYTESNCPPLWSICMRLGVTRRLLIWFRCIAMATLWLGCDKCWCRVFIWCIIYNLVSGRCIKCYGWP